MSKQSVPPPPAKRSGADLNGPRSGASSPRSGGGGGSPSPPGSGAKKSTDEPVASPPGAYVAPPVSTVGKDEAGEEAQETQMVALETANTSSTTTANASPEKDPRSDKEILWEIKTHNFMLLLAGLLLGMGLGYVIWVFVRKDLVFWVCAIIGLVAAKILEIKKFPQNLVRIWSAKVTEEMLKPPVNWRETFGSGAEFFVQSDMYDIDKNYVRSTAVYHNRNTCALTVRERFVRRSRLVDKLSMGTPYGTVIVATVSLAIAIGCYLNGADAGPNLSSAVTCFLVLFPVFMLVGCIIELELRKRRLLAFARAQERVTYLPLHTIGKMERKTYGGDHWKLLYTPPTADTKLRKILKVLHLILIPFMVLFKFILGIFMLATYNGAFAIWVWHCVATIVLYQAHVKKESKYVEPAMTLLWATFLVNIFEIWYCGPVNRCMDTCGNDPKSQLRKLELDADTRLPKDKVRKLVVGFCISLALVFISAIALSAITNNIFTNVEFVGVDKTWKQSYREHSNFILCKQSESDSNQTTDGLRRLLGEEDISVASEFMIQPRSQVLRSKFADDYDALCKDSTYRSMSVAVAFCTINWFFLLFLALYWHRYDKYQTRMQYQDNNIVWFDFTVFTIHSIPSKITWIGRIIGRYKGDMSRFFMHPGDATKLYRYLTDHVPWYATLNPNQPGARELMPM